MPPIDIAELRRLHEAATKGQWVAMTAEYEADDGIAWAQSDDCQRDADHAEYISACHNALPALLDELEAAREEVRRQAAQLKAAEAAIESDRTKLAEAITKIDKAMDSRFWLTEGRGSYAWDDDRYRDEFHSAGVEIKKAILSLRSVAADLANSPKSTKEVIAARLELQSSRGQRDGLMKKLGAAEELEALRSHCPECSGSGIERSGVCHCGESMDTHSKWDNHSAVEMTRSCRYCKYLTDRAAQLRREAGE